MKKYIALLLTAAVLLSLCMGCGNTKAEVSAEATAVREKSASTNDIPEPVSAMDMSAKEETDTEPVLREPLNYPLTEEQVTLTMFTGEPTLGPLPSPENSPDTKRSAPSAPPHCWSACLRAFFWAWAAA